MVELYVIIGASVVVSIAFLLLIIRLRGQDPELISFVETVTRELKDVDIQNPQALKEFMNRKMSEMDGEFRNDFSDVIDEKGLEFGEHKDDET